MGDRVRTSYNRRVKLENNNQSWILWGVRLNTAGIDKVMGEIEAGLNQSGSPIWVATVNPEFMMAAKGDGNFKKILEEKTTINVMDGVGLAWAREVLAEKIGVKRWWQGLKTGMEILRGEHREGLVTGVELINKLCQMAEDKGKTVFFFGGWGDRAKRTAEYFHLKYPKLRVVGYREENYDPATKTDILLVAYGMKKQEEWIDKNLSNLECRLVMGVGRSFDYYSGDLKRAPEWMRKMGLEWLYSLYKEPKRWKRQLVLPMFIAKVISDQ